MGGWGMEDGGALLKAHLAERDGYFGRRSAERPHFAMLGDWAMGGWMMEGPLWEAHLAERDGYFGHMSLCR